MDVFFFLSKRWLQLPKLIKVLRSSWHSVVNNKRSAQLMPSPTRGRTGICIRKERMNFLFVFVHLIISREYPLSKTCRIFSLFLSPFLFHSSPGLDRSLSSWLKPLTHTKRGILNAVSPWGLALLILSLNFSPTWTLYSELLHVLYD